MFVAVVPPDEALDDLDEFLDVRRAAADFRWSAREQWHLTLGFFAEVRERRLDELVGGLERVAARRTVFATRILGGGAFPDAAGAKVLWAGVDAGDDLSRLARGVRGAANTAGVRVDGARFRPHVTLARFGRPREVTRWVRVLDSYRGPEWEVSEIALIESHLGEGPRRSPRYETVVTIPLGALTGGRLGW